MKIYRILNPNRDYKTIKYSGTPIFNNLGKILWDNANEISNFCYTWETCNQNKDICDCPFIVGSIPVFSFFAYKKLSMYVNESNSQIIPIKIDDKSYFIVNAIILLDDILNKKKSKISYFSDGRIMNVDEYVFHNKRNIPDLFKISQFQTYTFVSEKLASAITEANITGISLEQCKSTGFISIFH